MCRLVNKIVIDNKITKSQLIDKITDSFNKRSFRQKGKCKPVRIRWNGEFIVTTSNKTVWRNIGDAKMAFKHHLNTVDYEIVGKYGNRLGIRGVLNVMNNREEYEVCDGSYQMLIEELLNAKILEFVEVDYETLADFSK